MDFVKLAPRSPAVNGLIKFLQKIALCKGYYYDIAQEGT